MNDEQVQLELSVPARAENIPLVRHAVAGFLDGHSVGGDQASDMLLAVTEACTNVVQHAYRDEAVADAEIEVWAELADAVVTITVRDQGGGFAPRVDSPGLGLGLPVIAALTTTVEIRPSPPSGTEVVMTFALGG
ncbi:MAG TPA: ATP-binding protein [Gaiellales bacterium]|nr:ATP-binding protein [Gaiellales bacterium]